jgi:proliferating cell nuclear antigen
MPPKIRIKLNKDKLNKDKLIRESSMSPPPPPPPWNGDGSLIEMAVLEYDRYFTKSSKGFKTKNSSYFKSIVSFINNIVECANFKLNKDGVKIVSMDKAHVALLDCFIPSSFFSHYNFTDGQCDITLGINIELLMKILNHLKPEDELIFEYKGDSLDISFINEKYKKFYNIKLMDIDSDELCIQDCSSATGINIESKYLYEIIKDFNDIGEVVKFIVSKQRIDNENQNIELECTGDMTGLRMVLCNDDLTLSNLQDISLEFSLKNLEIFSKGYNLNKFVNIEIDNNFPIKMSYQIISDGYINYFLAPRIED